MCWASDKNASQVEEECIPGTSTQEENLGQHNKGITYPNLRGKTSGSSGRGGRKLLRREMSVLLLVRPEPQPDNSQICFRQNALFGIHAYVSSMASEYPP